MSWVRIDDNDPDRPEVHRAGPVAYALHVAALSYCGRHLTDGRITASAAARLWDVADPMGEIEKLITVGLWEWRSDGDINIVGYLVTQPSRAQVEKLRAARAKAGRTGGKNSGRRRAANKQPKGEAIASPVASDENEPHPLGSSNQEGDGAADDRGRCRRHPFARLDAGPCEQCHREAESERKAAA